MVALIYNGDNRHFMLQLLFFNNLNCFYSVT